MRSGVSCAKAYHQIIFLFQFIWRRNRANRAKGKRAIWAETNSRTSKAKVKRSIVRILLRVIRICRTKLSWHRRNRRRNHIIGLERTRTARWQWRRWNIRRILRRQRSTSRRWGIKHKWSKACTTNRNLSQLGTAKSKANFLISSTNGNSNFIKSTQRRRTGTIHITGTNAKHRASVVKNQTRGSEPGGDKRPITNEAIEIVEPDPIVFFRGSSIPLSTDFAERVLPLISNQMGSAPSRFRNDEQEQTMRTVANGNNNETGSTNDPDPKFTGSTGSGLDPKAGKVSTNKRDEGTQNLKFPPLIGSTGIQDSTTEKDVDKTTSPTIVHAACGQLALEYLCKSITQLFTLFYFSHRISLLLRRKLILLYELYQCECFAGCWLT